MLHTSFDQYANKLNVLDHFGHLFTDWESDVDHKIVVIVILFTDVPHRIAPIAHNFYNNLSFEPSLSI